MRTQLATLARTTAMVIALGVTVAACGGSPSSNENAQRPAVNASAREPVEVEVLVPDAATCCRTTAEEDMPDAPIDEGIPLVDHERTPLQRLFYAPSPKGNGPEIALRFLRALQRRDHLAAAHELFYAGRDYFGRGDQASLDRVMRDIAANARLQNATPCTHAERLNREAAVVSCGRQKVVVHVLDGFAVGVQIAKWHPPYDVYRGPHTHAYTNDDLS